MKSKCFRMHGRYGIAFLILALVAGCTEDLFSPEIDLFWEEEDHRNDAWVHASSAQIDASLIHLAARATAIVPAGSSIQDAVDAAQPGAVILVEPGTYAEAVTIDKANISLMGKGGPGAQAAVIIENPGGAANGITVTAEGDGVRLADFTVRGFSRNGVFMSGVDGFHLIRLVAEDNGDYGLFPTRSSNGVMIHCRASGHADAGLYIGQSTDVRLLHNVVHENVIGIEASNSSDIEVSHNLAENNTIGILSVLLPPSAFRTVLTASEMLISQNTVRNNNLPNFAEQGSLPSFVPAGSGILVVGVDRTVVEKNDVSGNEWVGIGLGSTSTFGMLAGIPDVGLPDPDAEGVTIRKNRLSNNGSNPPPPPFPLPGVDLLWDGTGTDNCWENNEYETSFPSALPACRLVQ